MQYATESEIRSTITSARVTDPGIAIQFDDRVSRGDLPALVSLIASIVRLFLGLAKKIDDETASRVARSYLA
ncbi:hypothetical protein FDA94_36090 [Herbidospora galbida]|uniref:Uncharacterized protein n=1 Tax=Herbidospora galbida TaxID=2575442 RepID=A0A4U3LU87_9ACTN|nr:MULTISPECIES: hypothetical protein [Herbidospora]TKK79059.1 hypothetical protein FDA94_36090 [Herbidospora galbida]